MIRPLPFIAPCLLLFPAIGTAQITEILDQRGRGTGEELLPRKIALDDFGYIFVGGSRSGTLGPHKKKT